MEINLELLIPAIVSGDRKAFDIFFREYFGKVKRFAFGLTKDEFLSENIAQDIFLGLWVRRADFASIRQIDSYMYVCARNAALKALRERMKHASFDEIAETAAAFGSIEDEVVCREIRQRLLAAVGRMPGQQRRVFAMSRFQGKSNADIAAELGISVRTVEAHIHTALLQLRKMHLLVLLSCLTHIN